MVEHVLTVIVVELLFNLKDRLKGKALLCQELTAI